MQPMTGSLRHCLTFDIEEHFQVSAFESPMRRRHWDKFESRVERSTFKVLDMLEKRGIRATFFILGWVAERNRGLVHAIAGGGHEVASHGYSHELIMTQTPVRFREDVRKAKQILEDITGLAVHGYRAPSFTVTRETLWALPILVEEGYRYDSSIFPTLHGLYGIPSAPPYCHLLNTSAGSLWEIPPSTAKIAGIRVPVAGGAYLRLYPFHMLRWLLRRVELSGHPIVLYVHSWEFDPEQPRMDGSLLSQFRHYFNIDKVEKRLGELLETFNFGPMREVITPVAKMSVSGAGKESVCNV
jgi:polysaccharide deacetylase family protein (PEP-CTERM system associated)